MEESLQNTGFDPNRRELCPDGACIGVIGRDGRCKECGAESPNGPPVTAAPEEEEAPVTDAAEVAAPEPAPIRETEEGAFDPTQRELCPDGACIGVIGPDGRCKECGKPRE